MALSAPGIGSNLDVASIVAQLMAVERRPLAALDRREAGFQAQLSAYGTLKSALANLRTSLAHLADPTRTQALHAALADPAIAQASGGAAAVPGTYALQVTELAQSQTLIAGGQWSARTAIGSGADTTLTIEFGTTAGGTLANGQYSGASFTPDAGKPAVQVSITAANNSLEGIRDAINAAGAGVTATIVNDGSSAPYRLVLTSSATGEQSSMRVSVAGDGALEALLAHDPAGVQHLAQTAAARNAVFSLNGVAVTSASNTVQGAIAGITLNLARTGQTTLTVSPDFDALRDVVSSFVETYNGVHRLIAQVTGYNTQTGSAGTLTGDATARAIQVRLREALGLVPPALGQRLRTLADIGVSFQKDGSLALDVTRLQAAHAGGYRDFGALFGAGGGTTDPLLAYAGGSSSTQAGTYEVSVGALATRGSATGSVAPGPATVIAEGVNDELTLTLDGVTASVRLAAGSYTPGALAAELQSAIGAAAAFRSADVGATVTVNGGGSLVITSASHGSGSTVHVSGGSAQADVFGAAASATAGTDAAGTIGGVAAHGVGQFLTAASGTAADGLRIQVLGGATGARGAVTYTRGYASRLTELVDSLLAEDGPLSSRTEGVSRSLRDLGRQREALGARLADIERRHLAQFAALDRMLASMQQTSTFLQQQLAQLTRPER
jgi:flagellar hook-associated protein 2